MANGGGPACLRLRVVADPATVDPRFMVDEREARPDRGRHRAALARQIHIDELQRPALIRDIEAARAALLDALDLGLLANEVNLPHLPCSFKAQMAQSRRCRR